MSPGNTDVRSNALGGGSAVREHDGERAILDAPDGCGSLDSQTARLVRYAALIASADEDGLRAASAAAAAELPPDWVEEIILQSYIFAGFPRALNAAREWRRLSGIPAPLHDEGADYANVDLWRARGEVTCAAVYGGFYEQLRTNVRTLHPALDTWMVVEGYGKLLGRPTLDLRRRELCVMAVCAVARQERQLHSHVHGSLHVGAADDEVRGVLAVVNDLLPEALRDRYARLVERVLNG